MQVIQSPIRQPSPLRPCNNKENCSASRTHVRPLRVVHTEHLPDQFLSEALVPQEQGWLKFDLLLEQFKNQELFLKIKNLQSRNTFLISWIKNTSWLLRPLSWIFLMQSYWTPRKSRTRMIFKIKKPFLDFLNQDPIKKPFLDILNQEPTKNLSKNNSWRSRTNKEPFFASSWTWNHQIKNLESRNPFLDFIFFLESSWCNLIEHQENQVQRSRFIHERIYLDFLIPFLNNSRTNQETPKSREPFSLFGNQEILSWFLGLVKPFHHDQ